MRNYAWIALLLLTSCDTACRIAFCTEQTGLQEQYNAERDQCRALADLKAGMTPANDEVLDTAQKAQAVAAFSECMKEKGWDIPTGEEAKKAVPGAAGPPQWPYGTEPVAPVGENAQAERQRRAAECSFARQAAPTSLAARQRAAACDIECADQQRAAPEAPKSPACPIKP